MNRRPLVIALITALLLANSAHAEDKTYEPFVGITIHEITRAEPRPLVIHVADIDLNAKGIRFLVTPGNGDPNGDEPGDPNRETTRENTLDFLKEQHAQLAINATFFNMDYQDTDNIGLVVSDGEHISPFGRNWPAINIDKDNHATIVHGKNDTFEVTSPEGVTLYNAVAGSDQIVIDSKPLADQPDRSFFTTAHPRSAAGITQDNHLLLVTVDGRQEGYSEGMPLNELAQLMIDLGAVEALNLDGGGSTTFAIADPDPRLLNSPSSQAHEVSKTQLRKVGTSLAVFAEPKVEVR